MNERRSNEDIESVARKTLKENNMYDVPVNPFSLAAKLGIDIYEAEFEDDIVSGMIQKNGEVLELLVNGYDSSRRKRFTVAHELGHIVLHFGDGREEHIDSANDMYYNSKVMYRNNPNSNNAERYEEYEANQFAAALLMDAELIRYSWPRLKSIDLMADFFKVSSSAMEIRLKTLHLL